MPCIVNVSGFGLASHLGVLADVPCVGVGKKLYHVDGLKKGPEHKHKVKCFTQLVGETSSVSCGVDPDTVEKEGRLFPPDRGLWPHLGSCT